MSFYAATKKATENTTHSYAHLFDPAITMFRFFTVYRPWRRPDMALFKIIRVILEGRPIEGFNYGDMKRDFTCNDALIKAIRFLIDAPPTRLTDGGGGAGRQPVAGRTVACVQHSIPTRRRLPNSSG